MWTPVKPFQANLPPSASVYADHQSRSAAICMPGRITASWHIGSAASLPNAGFHIRRKSCSISPGDTISVLIISIGWRVNCPVGASCRSPPCQCRGYRISSRPTFPPFGNGHLSAIALRLFGSIGCWQALHHTIRRTRAAASSGCGCPRWRVHLRRRQRLANRWRLDLVEDAFQRSDTRRERIPIGVYGVGQQPRECGGFIIS